MLSTPAAVVCDPRAVLAMPDAVVCEPPATLASPLAVVFQPKARLADPAADDPCPKAELLVPVAVAAVPKATLLCPLAIEPSPNAVLYRPTLPSSHCVPPTPPARKAALPAYHIIRVPGPLAGMPESPSGRATMLPPERREIAGGMAPSAGRRPRIARQSARPA